MFRVALVAGFVRATVGANPSFNFVVMGGACAAVCVPLARVRWPSAGPERGRS
jgi:hypothetical protein